METPVSVMLVLIVVIATVASLSFYLANRYPGSPSQFDEVLISNLVPYEHDYTSGGRVVTEYLISYRVACRKAPLTVTSGTVDLYLKDGTHQHIKITFNGNHGYGSYGNTIVNMYIDSKTVCLNPGGYDHAMRIVITSNEKATINYIELYMVHPAGSVWRAVIYLPEKSLPYPGG